MRWLTLPMSFPLFAWRELQRMSGDVTFGGELGVLESPQLARERWDKLVATA
jgi:hypothetical protein